MTGVQTCALPISLYEEWREEDVSLGTKIKKEGDESSGKVRSKPSI